MKSLCFFLFFSFTTLLSFSEARKFNVGGTGAWVPNPPASYQSWAEESRFLVHDTLYFNYAKGADSVLEVSKADFDACNTKNPLKKMEDGETEVSLDRSGPFYFITGNEENCKKGQKVSVVVLSVKHASAPGTSPPGAPSPKSSSTGSPTTSPPAPGSMAPKSSSPGSMAPKSSSPGSPTTSSPGSMAPKSSSPGSPTTSPPGSMAPKSSSPPAPMAPSSAPGSSPSGTMAPKSSSALSPSSAPGASSSSGSSSSPSDSPANSPSSSSSSDSPPAPSPIGSDLGPSANGPSAAGDITAPAGAPGQKKSPANRMVVMSVVTALSLVLTIFVSV